MVKSKSLEKTTVKVVVDKPIAKKRKKKTKAPLEQKIIKKEVSEPVATKQISDAKKNKSPKIKSLPIDDISIRFPVLKNADLIKKFQSVTMTNNQKGRIRQLLKDNLKGTSDTLLPEVIHSKIQAVLRSSVDLTDTELRKIRILYNMLKTALKAETTKKPIEKKAEEKVKKVPKEGEEKKKEIKKDKEQQPKKIKKKRYVVFLGNLPLNVDKEMIMKHFSELNENIVDIRIPKVKDGKKSAIAYVELGNEPTYELALSRHHSMMGSKRINVLYTTQKDGKITKSEAKSKSAKLLALQRSGKLIGSTPSAKKRSHRRAKLRQARAREQQDN